MTDLIDAYDAALFDLDGVLYVGANAVEGAPATVQELRARGVRLAYVTNNASRAPSTVADHLTRLGMPTAEADVVSSAQAVAALIAGKEPPNTRVLVVGTQALADEIADVGLIPVQRVEDNPKVLVQGYNPQWTVAQLQDACVAVQAGLRWYASNDDRTIPTDRGIMPGMGSYIALISAACGGATPMFTAGKPHTPLMEAALARISAARPIFVGDRLDTDIEGANAAGIASLFVTETGAHGKVELLAATPQQRPTHIGSSVAALLQPARQVERGADTVTVGKFQAKVEAGRITLHSSHDSADPWDGLWALANLAWAHPEADYAKALSRLDHIH